ncbi:MAG: NUDIX domain-containing protein [Bacteroidetes bacterium]|nr:NUDIX domain-containing protein [Bacteroidota bacterium]
MPEIVSKIVEVFIFRRNGKKIEYLLLKRSDNEVYPGIWSVAGGKIRENEKAYQTAYREMKEETGLNAIHFYAVDTVNVFYEVNDDMFHLTPVFLAETDDTDVVLSDEHDDFKWSAFEEAYEDIHWSVWKKNLKVIDKTLQNENLFRTLKSINF